MRPFEVRRVRAFSLKVARGPLASDISARLDIFFFLSRVCPTTVEAAVARVERFLPSLPLYISFSIYFISRFFSEHLRFMTSSIFIASFSVARRNRMRYFAFGNYRRFFTIFLRKKQGRRKLFESEESNSEMMTATALAGRSRSSSRMEGTKKGGGERVERGWRTGDSGEKNPLFCTRDVRAKG